jgi:hypothetical protein
MNLIELKNIKIDVMRMMYDTFSNAEVQSKVIDTNRNRLSDKGTRVTGEKIRTFAAPSYGVYAVSTVKIKQGKGQRTDIVTLKDTGKWHSSLELKVSRREAIIKDDGYLKETIAENLDIENVLGFGDEDKNKVIEIIKPQLIKQLKTTLKL